ncbi:LysR family transcriptional regulator [Phormidium sp. CCY1219]|uniref:LysR family transcriptional regulator n=1 Tax=Phormidium sp. CCY1219 TaxID=2886104 RepID=UPI002D1F3B8F|nr:LysR family transcriptional regulator [Phormidium sp. CCY1219]MEB3827104.1 LysR family transcriptional regulator [Phormidium sp. CCY1219]
MRLEQLQAFLAIADTGSFQQAARRCGVTQSTISRQIQALEAELGLPLFHRMAQAKLTLAGENFFTRARKICQEWETAKSEIADLLAGKQPELCVAAIHSVCAYYLPPVLHRFCGKYPEVQLRVTALGSDRALKVLKDGLVDLAIVMNNRLFTTTPDMVVEVLYEESIQVLMAANHPLADRDRIPWTELANHPQVVFKDGYGMQRMVQDLFAKEGLPLRAVLELNTPDAFRGVVRQGKTIALLPQSALVEARLDPSLAVRELTPQLPSAQGVNLGPASPQALQMSPTNPWNRQVVIATTSDRLQIPPIAHFWEIVRDIVPQQFSESIRSTPAIIES